MEPVTAPMTVEGAAKALGVSTMTIYRRIEDGTFSVVRDFKGKMHIPAAEIEDVLTQLREAGFGRD